MSLTLVFVHGWAFGPSFWDRLGEELPGYPFRALDLGYFGLQHLDFIPEGSGPVVAVGHSLGFQWLLGDAPFRFDALVSLGGFARFDVPPGPVRAMRRGLSRDAARVVRDFRKACGLPADDAAGLSGIDPDRLAQGLDRLLTLDETPALASLAKPLLAVAAEDDLIVPPALSRAIFPDRLAMLPSGGHAFPVTRAGECAALIRQFLETL
ncbi:MAG: alpha/beta fold hydrolase [Thermodesulfobacteriota bacterium]